ncbi:MAG TPA: hypothetical protein VM802_27830 [Chitinophaga sp.]|uniref:hypothetical protein n=1 Tax=Chitinophaga sp. TaxID=1869181 RepID=UPI002C8DDEE4|nr:hypothetical protein [Chitinophaga sp.]HVI48710.1 hypothetical protein [Chitinophaga sp.]
MVSNEVKYELRAEDSDEFMVSSTYNLLSKWGALIFLAVLTAVISLCCFIRIPVTYTSKIDLECNTSQPAQQHLYSRIAIPENIAYSARTDMPVNVTFTRINDKRKFRLDGKVDSIFFDKGRHAYYLSISIPVAPKDRDNGLLESGICTQPAQAVLVISERSIISSILL